MRISPSEKMEIIRIVERSELGVKRTLQELQINRSTFYNWYAKYQKQGYCNRKFKDNLFILESPKFERSVRLCLCGYCRL